MSNENEMKLETFVSASTTVNKVKHKSNVTIDWTGMRVADLQALAQRSIVIRKQNADRLAEVVPPPEYKIKATDFRIGTRVVKEKQTPEQMLAALSPEERAALIAKFLNS